ncbi:amino acid ABC transporter ATP-binding protein [Limobrevibacterium gyesilva]|uniref:Amino acid ABC transporter ATP-binding protein n=1 Tax=Limobrevibacterium gyesilva TaxID=2991712 RepID=A0AA41YMI4_9PROT|nr:amino acid ABC transporter ATP-binding protein [Limobrevibacterium gyesilva]MCW3473228.1 amino acid ABC transporter ATP-binding protein [Limobrevibacterium gyesilva]
MPIVLVEDLRKSFGSLEVLKGISLSVERGQVVALLGRSGSGKSTLLRCLNGLETISSGRIEIGGHVMSYAPAALRALRKDVGIVFQSFNLFPHLSAAENVMLAPRVVKKTPKREARELAMEMLGKVGLIDKADVYPDQLSGGQQQRVAIARSLAMQPRVMLFDEVTSALDPELTGEVLNVMERLAAEGMTMLLVTHEMEFARRVATTTVFMYKGLVHETGSSKELFGRPSTSEFRQFLGVTSD